MFASWANFYMLLGEASASLIGLLFVVSTLSVRLQPGTASSTGAGLFLTPTVFKFATVLAISAIALAPGLSDPVERGLVLTTAAVGLINLAGVSHGLFGGKAGSLHWSDPWCYGAAPTVLFLGLGAAALLPDATAAGRGVGIAAAVILLLAVRNAWDLVTALAQRVRDGTAPPPPSA